MGEILDDNFVADDSEATCEGVVSQIADLETDCLVARYEISCVLHTARCLSQNVPAHRALARFGQRLGLDESTLRKWDRVSEVIRRKEFASIVDLRNRHGLPLTWSHIERLARVRERDERCVVAVQAALHNWSANELSRRIRTSGT